MLKIIKQIKQSYRNNRSEFYFILLFIMAWVPSTVNFIAVFVSKVIGFPSLVNLLPAILSLCFILKSHRFWRHRIKSTDIIFYIVCIVLCTLNYVVDSTNSKMQLLFLPLFASSLMLILLGIGVDIAKLKLPLYYASVVNLLVSAFYYLVYTQGTSYSGSMEALSDSATAHIGDESYKVLPSVAYIVWITIYKFNFFSKETFFNGALSILGFLLISAFGTRGPLVCFILFFCLYVFFFNQTKYKYFIRVISCIIGTFLYFTLDFVLLFMVELMHSMGMSGRIFQYAIDGTFTGGEASADERVSLLHEAEQTLSSNDLSTYIGHGYLGWSKCMSGYPHNIYYDVMTSFGYIFGSLFLVYLAYLLIKSYYSHVPIEWKSLVLICSTSGLFQLFMSGTFWGVPFFYLLIGLCINIIRTSKFQLR